MIQWGKEKDNVWNFYKRMMFALLSILHAVAKGMTNKAK